MIKLPEILLIDKPPGITSADVIRRLKESLGSELKMGHAGTLDPMATGLIIVGIGEGTKKLDEYLNASKEYEAEITLGVATDSQDADGEIIEKSSPAHITDEEIAVAVQNLQGKLRLPVSKFSAIKQGGEPLYKKARRNDPLVVPLRDMYVNRAKLIAISRVGQEIQVAVHFDVESGTYIRSLAVALGGFLQTPAHLSKLRRTRIGPCSIENASEL